MQPPVASTTVIVAGCPSCCQNARGPSALHCTCLSASVVQHDRACPLSPAPYSWPLPWAHARRKSTVHYRLEESLPPHALRKSTVRRRLEESFHRCHAMAHPQRRRACCHNLQSSSHGVVPTRRRRKESTAAAAAAAAAFAIAAVYSPQGMPAGTSRKTRSSARRAQLLAPAAKGFELAVSWLLGMPPRCAMIIIVE